MDSMGRRGLLCHQVANPEAIVSPPAWKQVCTFTVPLASIELALVSSTVLLAKPTVTVRATPVILALVTSTERISELAIAVKISAFELANIDRATLKLQHARTMKASLDDGASVVSRVQQTIVVSGVRGPTNATFPRSPVVAKMCALSTKANRGLRT